MIYRTTLLIIKIFDYFHKKKIISFLKKNKKSEINTIIDVGGHTGESIDLFLKNFSVKKIISFEASPINFKKLETNCISLKKKYKNTEISIENYAAGNEEKVLKINQFVESSSSTLKPLNKNSSYFKKKFFFLKKNLDGNLFYEIEVKLILLYDYLTKNNIKNVDLLKIDTEGYEHETILGLRNKIENVKFIFFEHHYDNMIEKNYKFSDIHKILKENNFNQIYKIKMPFRKSFEYIYENIKK